MVPPYDSILIISFGGPECMDDVMPFLRDVVRGRNVPEERLKLVARHYELVNGRSPLNDQVRGLVSALKTEMEIPGLNLPVYWGNRHWHPFLAETLAQMKQDGCSRSLAFVTAAHSSYSSCRQYLEEICRARQQVGVNAPEVDKIRAFYNHPLFIKANADNLRMIVDGLPADRRANLHVLFTAHSIPTSMAETCGYTAQLNEACHLVADMCNIRNWQLVYQSRSGAPGASWLEPDILSQIAVIGQSVDEILVHPIGFVHDHMEVIYDLDFEAKSLCDRQGILMHRSRTAGHSPEFVEMIRDLILERIEDHSERPYLGNLGPLPDACPPNCCPPRAPSPNVGAMPCVAPPEEPQ